MCLAVAPHCFLDTKTGRAQDKGSARLAKRSETSIDALCVLPCCPQAEKRRHADLQAAADKAKQFKDPAAASAEARRQWWGKQQYEEREQRRQNGDADEDDDIAYYRCGGGVQHVRRTQRILEGLQLWV